MITIAGDAYADTTYEVCENISISVFEEGRHLLALQGVYYGTANYYTDEVLGFNGGYVKVETSNHYTAKEVFHYTNLALFRMSADFLGHKGVVIKIGDEEGRL